MPTEDTTTPHVEDGTGDDPGRPDVTTRLASATVHEPGTPPELVPQPEEDDGRLGQQMGKGLAWSLLNNVVGRLGSFVLGIVVVRLLTNAEFGTYAVGLVVLTVLLSMNELGVSVAVVQRKGDVEDIAPTVMTISVLSSAVLAAIAFVAAPALAETMGAPDATWLIRLLVVGILVDGFAAVPNALITRAMQQRKRLLIDTLSFLVGTPVTLGLALAGYGGWALGWGAVVGNVVGALAAFVWAPRRYRPGWRPSVVPELMRFGLPLAGASLLLFLMMNLDYVVVGHRLGAVQLGLYLLAFNVASWPTTVIGSAIRRVTLAAFARMHQQHDDGGSDGFARVVGLVMMVTLPICAGLSLYADPLVGLVYGDRWSAAAGPLHLLVVFAAARVAVELAYDFLAGAGYTRSTVWLHAVWLVALVPALLAGATLGGIVGVAAAHAVVVVVVLLPLLALLLHGAGIRLRGLARHVVRPVLGTLALTLPAPLVLGQDWPAVVQLVVGAVAGGLLYLPVVWPMRKSAITLWQLSH